MADKKVLLFGEHSKNLEYIGKMDESEELDKDTLAIILDVANAPRVDNQEFNNCGYILKIEVTVLFLNVHIYNLLVIITMSFATI